MPSDPLLDRLSAIDPAKDLAGEEARSEALLENLRAAVADNGESSPNAPRRPRLTVALMAGVFGAALAIAVAVLALTSLHHRAPRKADGGVVRIRPGVDIQQYYDKAGSPGLIANVSGAGRVTSAPRWSICSPVDHGHCHVVRGDGGDSRSTILRPGSTSPGTVFQATVTESGHTYVARTGTWEGAVHVVKPPTLTGAPRFGSVVIPHAGRWAGGWSALPTGSEAGPANGDGLSVEACRTPEARQCVNLTPQGDHAGYSTRPITLDNSFTRWYLFAFDQRYGAPFTEAAPGYSSPAAMPVVKVGPTTARSAPLGPVTGPPAPTVSILHKAILQHGQVLVARVRCQVRCRVRIFVQGERSGSGAVRHVEGSALVGVPRRQMHAGLLKVSVAVGAGPGVGGRTRLR